MIGKRIDKQRCKYVSRFEFRNSIPQVKLLEKWQVCGYQAEKHRKGRITSTRDHENTVFLLRVIKNLEKEINW